MFWLFNAFLLDVFPVHWCPGSLSPALSWTSFPLLLFIVSLSHSLFLTLHSLSDFFLGSLQISTYAHAFFFPHSLGSTYIMPTVVVYISPCFLSSSVRHRHLTFILLLLLSSIDYYYTCDTSLSSDVTLLCSAPCSLLPASVLFAPCPIFPFFPRLPLHSSLASCIRPCLSQCSPYETTSYDNERPYPTMDSVLDVLLFSWFF